MTLTRQRPMSRARKKLFIEVLKSSGSIMEAARQASPHSRSMDGCRSSFNYLRKIDAAFDAECREALEYATDALITEARRRGLGWTEPLIHQGKPAFNPDGSPVLVHKHSDAVLLALLRAHVPVFADKSTLNVNTQPTGTVSFEPEALNRLSQAQAIELSALLKTMKATDADLVVIDNEGGADA